MLSSPLGYSAGRRFSAAVQDLPVGGYESEAVLEKAGSDPDARLHLRLSTTGGQLRFDFSGCLRQKVNAMVRQ